MRSRFIEINNELVSLITKLKDVDNDEGKIIKEIKSLIRMHEKKYPNRFKQQNTYSDQLNNFKLFE